MRSVNKVIMIGNLVAAPEVVQINAENKVAKFTLAVNESYKKSDGEQIEVTTYIDCEAWGGLARIVENYLHKGSKVYIEGNLRADKWTDADTGKSRTKHKVRVNDLVMLDAKKDGDNTLREDNFDEKENVIKPAEDDELPF